MSLFLSKCWILKYKSKEYFSFCAFSMIVSTLTTFGSNIIVRWPLPEWRGDTAVWNPGFGRGDQSSHPEAEGMGSPSSCREEPADPLRHGLHPTWTAGGGADYRGLELPMGSHSPAINWSYRSRYCSLFGLTWSWARSKQSPLSNLNSPLSICSTSTDSC